MFTTLGKRVIETVANKEILGNKCFLIFPLCFLSFHRQFLSPKPQSICSLRCLYVWQLNFLAPTLIDWGHIVFAPSVTRFVCKKKVKTGHNFWMVSDTAFIFHMYIPLGKTFSLVSRSRFKSSVKVKVKYLGHNMKKMVLVGTFVFHKDIFFLLYAKELKIILTATEKNTVRT